MAFNCFCVCSGRKVSFFDPSNQSYVGPTIHIKFFEDDDNVESFTRVCGLCPVGLDSFCVVSSENDYNNTFFLNRYSISETKGFLEILSKQSLEIIGQSFIDLKLVENIAGVSQIVGMSPKKVHYFAINEEEGSDLESFSEWEYDVSEKSLDRMCEMKYDHPWSTIVLLDSGGRVGENIVDTDTNKPFDRICGNRICENIVADSEIGIILSKGNIIEFRDPDPVQFFHPLCIWTMESHVTSMYLDGDVFVVCMFDYSKRNSFVQIYRNKNLQESGPSVFIGNESNERLSPGKYPIRRIYRSGEYLCFLDDKGLGFSTLEGKKSFWRIIEQKREYYSPTFVCPIQSSNQLHSDYAKKLKKMSLDLRNNQKEDSQDHAQDDLIGVVDNRSQRVRGIIGFLMNEEFSRLDPSREFREGYGIGFDKNILEKIFFDRGPDKLKTFLPFPMVRNGVPDEYFETIVLDRSDDIVIDSFLSMIERKYKKEWESLYKEFRSKICQEFVEKSVFPFLKQLIREVSVFFGGFNNVDLERICKDLIWKAQAETMTNKVYLGKLKGAGLCRHRSILFKAVCDLIGVKCSISRGNLNLSYKKELKGKFEPHGWNVVQLKSYSCIVDCTNCEVPLGSESEFLRYFEDTIEKKRLAKITLDEKRFGEFFFRNFVIPTASSEEEEEKEEEEEEEEGDDSSVTTKLEKMGKSNIYRVTIEGNQRRVVFPNGGIVTVKVTPINEDVNNHLQYLKNEASLIKEFNHQCVIKSYTSFRKYEKYFCLVLERLPYDGSDFIRELSSKSLEKWKNKCLHQSIETLVFLIQVARGVRYIHDCGYVHLDIKPSNVLVSWNENFVIEHVKLIDFVGMKENWYGKVNPDTVFSISKDYCSPEVGEFIKELKEKNQRSSSQSEEEESEGEDMVETKFDESADIFSFGKMVQIDFLKYLSFTHVAKDLFERCVIEKETKERPKFDEIIHKLRLMLEYLDYYRFTKKYRRNIDYLED